jgi:hypothetical protein
MNSQMNTFKPLTPSLVVGRVLMILFMCAVTYDYVCGRLGMTHTQLAQKIYKHRQVVGLVLCTYFVISYLSFLSGVLFLTALGINPLKDSSYEIYFVPLFFTSIFPTISVLRQIKLHVNSQLKEDIQFILLEKTELPHQRYPVLQETHRQMLGKVYG